MVFMCYNKINKKECGNLLTAERKKIMTIYRKIFHVYWNDINVSNKSNFCLLYDDALDKETEEIKITWENLNDVYYKYGLMLPFNIWNFKKGRYIELYDGSIFNKKLWGIKENKTPNPNVKIIIEYEKRDDFTIHDIITRFDVDKAIRYLKEKGLEFSI